VGTYDYSGLSGTAQKLVNKFGKSVTITHVEAGAYDAGAGTSSGDVTTNQTLQAVSLPASGGKIAALDERFELGGQIFQDYAFITISGDDITFEPSPGDAVAMDSKTWYVIGVTPTRPNVGDAIIYELALRI